MLYCSRLRLDFAAVPPPWPSLPSSDGLKATYGLVKMGMVVCLAFARSLSRYVLPRHVPPFHHHHACSLKYERYRSLDRSCLLSPASSLCQPASEAREKEREGGGGEILQQQRSQDRKSERSAEIRDEWHTSRQPEGRREQVIPTVRSTDGHEIRFLNCFLTFRRFVPKTRAERKEASYNCSRVNRILLVFFVIVKKKAHV